MKFVLISPKNRTAYNFRGDLLKDIKSQGYDIAVTGPNQDDADRITALEADFHEIPMRKNGMNPLADIAYTIKLIRLFRKLRPDVVMGYTIKPVIYGSVAAKMAGVKHINAMITGTGYVFISKSFKAAVVKKIVSLLYRIGLGCAETVIFQNPDDMQQFVSEKLVKNSKCRLVNGSGVNMEQFVPAPFPDTVTFFMLSRVMASKGVREYLGAAEKVKAKHPKVRFMLLGAIEGIQDSLKPEEVQTYIDRRIVEHFGETDDVSTYYRQCSVYVLPSYGEGTPRTVLEAMAMGRPIITTDTPGCRETVVDGENGYIVPAMNI